VKRLKVAMILADERDVLMRYDLPDPFFGSAPSALLEGFAGSGELEVHVIGCVRNRLRVPEKLADNIYYHAVRVSRWAFLRTAYLPCIFKIRTKLKQIKPDMVHGQGTERYQGLAAAYSGFPSVLTVHGNMRQIAKALRAPPFSFHWLTGQLEPLALRRASGVLCLSHYTFQQVHTLARRTWTLPNAVQKAFFGVKREPASPARVLCVANIAAYKNQNFLMRTLDPIAANSGIQLIFLGRVGSDSYSQEFLCMVKARPWCSHQGFQAGPALRAHFATARLLVLPSLEDNCPMVVLEAMAAGLPVAASRIGGIPDLVQDGETGALFDPTEPAALRETVERLTSDRALASRLSNNARQHAERTYHPRIIARQHCEIYRQLVGRPEKASIGSAMGPLG
jgi:glycosyltransferase involved in cell wall biosynthesis